MADPTDPRVDRAALARLSELAQLDLTGLEDALAADLDHIVAMVERLRSVDTNDVEALHSPVRTPQPLRPDRVTERDDRAALLANAPATADGLFLVPRVVE